MTNRLESPSARRLLCSECGSEFGCDPAGGCWCADESFRLPMPTEGQDCLCRNCLAVLAATQAAKVA